MFRSVVLLVSLAMVAGCQTVDPIEYVWAVGEAEELRDQRRRIVTVRIVRDPEDRTTYCPKSTRQRMKRSNSDVDADHCEDGGLKQADAVCLKAATHRYVRFRPRRGRNQGNSDDTYKRKFHIEEKGGRAFPFQVDDAGNVMCEDKGNFKLDCRLKDDLNEKYYFYNIRVGDCVLDPRIIVNRDL